MRLSCGFLAMLALSGVHLVTAKSSWGFEDATVSIQSKSDDSGVKLNKEKCAQLFHFLVTKVQY